MVELLIPHQVFELLLGFNNFVLGQLEILNSLQMGRLLFGVNVPADIVGFLHVLVLTEVVLDPGVRVFGN